MEKIDNQYGVAHVTISLVLVCGPGEITVRSESMKSIEGKQHCSGNGMESSQDHLHQCPGYNAWSSVVKQLEVP